MSTELVVNNVNDIVMYQEQTFNSVCVDDKITFAKESQFAMQLMQKNDFLNKIAWQNQSSLQNAIINVASIGISLNPAKKHAYLVPRDRMVCLDISYIGLMHLAMSTGSILWGQCKLVKANDKYTNNGLDKAPTHLCETFGDRGDVIGGYCTVKTPQGDYLTEEMSIKDIHEIRARSQGFKSGKNSPWKTDHDEMARKTIVKRASKYWPQVDRLDDAIHMLNTDGGEGIASKAEKVQEVIINPSDAIGQSLTKQGKTWEQFFEWAGKMLKKEVASLDDLTEQELQTFASKLEAR